MLILSEDTNIDHSNMPLADNKIQESTINEYGLDKLKKVSAMNQPLSDTDITGFDLIEELKVRGSDKHSGVP